MWNIIYVLASKVPEYNSANLLNIDGDYKRALTSYRERCIRARLANIRAMGRRPDSGGNGNMIQFDILDLKYFPKYFCSE
jgi:hypothetical protein